MRIISVIMVLACCASCASAPPQLPSPANLRKSLSELNREDKARMLNPPPGDQDAIVLRADHEFLACGGDQVGKMYQAVLDKSPDHIRANLGMGEWYVCHRRLKESVPLLRKVLDLADKDSPEYVQALGVLQYVQYQLTQE